MISPQTTQFVLQGYSDTIKTNPAETIGNTLAQTGQALNQSMNDYTQRQALNEQTKASKIANQYEIDRYSQRLDLADLENESLRGKNYYQNLINQNQEMQNDITRQTKNSQIQATKARNLLTTASDNYIRDQTQLQHKSIQPQSIYVKDSNGKYRRATPAEVKNEDITKYKDAKGKQSYNQYEAIAANNAALNRASITQAAGYGFQNQAQQQNLLIKQQALQNESAKESEQQAKLLKAKIDELHNKGKISELQKLTMPYIKWADENIGQVYEMQNLYYKPHLDMNVRTPYSTQNLNINGNLAISNANIDKFARDIALLKSKQGTEEQIEFAKNRLIQSPNIKKANENLSKLTGGSIELINRGILEQKIEKNRAYEALGLIAKVLPGEYQSEAIAVQKEFSNNALNLKIATKTLSGSLSNQDMQQVKQLLPKMFVENKLAGYIKLLNLTNSQIKAYEEQFYAGGDIEIWETLNPTHYNNYMRLKNNFNFLYKTVYAYLPVDMQ
ncbi:hypothetical protein LS73_008860 [Helicobacter muridarum]|uniref:Uncharacterized protein n=1 Tax=Helicobacter muridarum TaxID=216 RepID=A0A099U1V9_9HELI|nr:hypothetical protein [Helicobacter muridarum]TLD98498.1 hypothetical protein LS73_008860 [Helicobacter muridarum]STQ85770.1 Uncharacterised protein [Helicobacter muridarum]